MITNRKAFIQGSNYTSFVRSSNAMGMGPMKALAAVLIGDNGLITASVPTTVHELALVEV